MVKKQKKKSINYFKRIVFSIAGKRYNEMIDYISYLKAQPTHMEEHIQKFIIF